MGENIITWNATNWITIGLMSATFAAVIGAAVHFVKKQQASNADAS